MAFSSILNEIVAAIKASWADITADSQIYTSYDALRANLLEDKSNAFVSFPLVVIDIGNRQPETSLSIDSNQQRLPLSIWYITTQKTIGATSSQLFVADKGTALQTYFRSHSGTYWYQMEAPSVDSSASEAFNMKAGLDSKTEMIAVHVQWEPGLLIDGTV